MTMGFKESLVFLTTCPSPGKFESGETAAGQENQKARYRPKDSQSDYQSRGY